VLADLMGADPARYITVRRFDLDHLSAQIGQ
jgi:hypothetical protein